MTEWTDYLTTRFMLKHDIEKRGFIKAIKTAFKCGFNKEQIKEFLK